VRKKKWKVNKVDIEDQRAQKKMPRKGLRRSFRRFLCEYCDEKYDGICSLEIKWLKVKVGCQI